MIMVAMIIMSIIVMVMNIIMMILIIIVNVPLTITITDAVSPYSNHSAFGFETDWCPALHGHRPAGTRASRAQPPARVTRPAECHPRH